jgi:hypothetical protein
MKVDTTMGHREMELSRRSAFQHNDALPVEHGSPLGLAAELVQQGTVTLAEQGALDHHTAEALDLPRLVPATGEAPVGSFDCLSQRSPVCAVGPWWSRRSLSDGSQQFA